MDLVLSIIMLVAISSYKMIQSPSEITIEASVTDDYGIVTETVVKENNLVVVKNLMLRREPRAYHKILDEMGLS